MSRSASIIKIALIGDYRPNVTAHVCAPRAIELAAKAIDAPVSACWIETRWLGGTGVEGLTGSFDAIWCVPASPYRDQTAVLEAIRIVRTRNIPFLGTCGGFQHAVIEYARNELALPHANSTEDDPDTACAVVDQMTCSLREVSSTIRLSQGSRLAAIYGAPEISEPYNCGYGFNPQFESRFINSALKFCGYDDSPKAFELEGHGFFIGTAFQPERSALENTVHPLIKSFVEAAVQSCSSKMG